jgi:hypothetical protein
MRETALRGAKNVRNRDLPQFRPIFRTRQPTTHLVRIFARRVLGRSFASSIPCRPVVVRLYGAVLAIDKNANKPISALTICWRKAERAMPAVQWEKNPKSDWLDGTHRVQRFHPA